VHRVRPSQRSGKLSKSHICTIVMMDSSTVWNGQDPTLSVSSQDDFQQFLDMNLGESLQFDFQDFNPQQAQTTQLTQREDGETMDTGMNSGGILAGQDTSMQEHMPSMTTASSHPTIHAAALAQTHSSNESLSELDAQIQYLQNQRHQQQQRQIQERQRNFYAQSGMIPPTPNSIEMHGNHTQFYPQSDPQLQAMFERYRMQVKEQEVSTMNMMKNCPPRLTTIDGLYPSGITSRHSP
jgi:hypothetical protein